MVVIKETKHFILDKPQKLDIIFLIKWFITLIQSIYYKLLIRITARSNTNKKQHYITICGIFKNEGPYLKEWIEYNRIIGIDHIYLYNNNSIDNYYEILSPYIYEDYVTLIDWPHNQKQMEAYYDCFSRFRNESNWIGFIDLDEFIVPVESDDIKTFFEKFRNRPSVLLYWKMFGTSGKVSRNINDLVTEDFTSCWYKYDDIGKCFINTNYDISDKQKIIHHMLWTKCGIFDLPPVNCCDNVCVRDWYNSVSKKVLPIHINHYVLKSYDEYMGKAGKSDVMFKNNPKGAQHFYRHEMLSTNKDYSIYKYLVKLKLVMEESK